jgi:hypothetical protein
MLECHNIDCNLMQEDRRNAFSVLKKAAKKRSSDPPLNSARKPKIARPGPGKYEECPVCSCQIPSAFLAEHAARCGLGGGQQSDAGAAARGAADAHTHAHAAPEPGSAISGDAAQHAPEPAAGVCSAAEAQAGAALPDDQPSGRSMQAHIPQLQALVSGSAFEHMLQRQKDLSRVLSAAKYPQPCVK